MLILRIFVSRFILILRIFVSRFILILGIFVFWFIVILRIFVSRFILILRIFVFRFISILRIFVLRFILASSSSFFLNLLYKNPHSNPLIYLSGIKFRDLVSILDFMYRGQVKTWTIN